MWNLNYNHANLEFILYKLCTAVVLLTHHTKNTQSYACLFTNGGLASQNNPCTNIIYKH